MTNLIHAFPQYLEASALTNELINLLSAIEVRMVFNVEESESDFNPEEEYISMGSLGFEYDENHDSRFDFHRWKTTFETIDGDLKLIVWESNLDIDFLIEESKSAEAFPLTPTPELLAHATLSDIYIDWEFPAELTLDQLVVSYPLSNELDSEVVEIKFNGADYPNLFIGN